MLDTLLRLPSPRFPADMRTGDSRVDSYLETLDSALTGSAGVRRHTLFEARDYLSEAQERARATDTDEDAALRAAIEDFGQAEHVGREQRRTCAASFRAMACWMGVLFATLMLILSMSGLDNPTATWRMQTFAFAFNAVFFGSFTAFFMVYVFPRPMPTLQDAAGPESFSVHCTRLTIHMGWGLATVIVTMLMLIVWGLTGRGFFSDWPLPVLILMLLSNVVLILLVFEALFFRAAVQADTLHLRGIGGSAAIKRGQIVSVVAPRLLLQVSSPTNTHLRRLTWRDDAGRIRSRYVSLSRDLVHGDRLMAWLEAAASRNTACAETPRTA